MAMNPNSTPIRLNLTVDLDRSEEESANTTLLIDKLQVEKSDLEDHLAELGEQLNLLEENSLKANESKDKAEVAKLNAEAVLEEATEMLSQVEKIKASASSLLDLLSNILSSFDRKRRSSDDMINRSSCSDLLATIGRMNAELQLGTKEGLREGYGYAVALSRPTMSPACTPDNNNELAAAKDGIVTSLSSVARVVALEKEAVAVVAADLINLTYY